MILNNLVAQTKNILVGRKLNCIFSKLIFEASERMLIDVGVSKTCVSVFFFNSQHINTYGSK